MSRIFRANGSPSLKGWRYSSLVWAGHHSPPFLGRRTWFSSTISSAQVAGHTQESKDVVTMVILLLWWNLCVWPPCWGLVGRIVYSGDSKKKIRMKLVQKCWVKSKNKRKDPWRRHRNEGHNLSIKVPGKLVFKQTLITFCHYSSFLFQRNAH